MSRAPGGAQAGGAARGRAPAVLALLAFILVPFALFGERADAWAHALLTTPGSRALAALLVATLLTLDVLLPVPSSLVGVLGGALLGPVGGALAVFAGLSGGALLGYGLGRTVGRAALVALAGDVERRDPPRPAGRWGLGALILARPVPVLAEASVILAGVERVPLPAFLGAVLAANAALAVAYGWIGAAGAAVLVR